MNREAYNAIASSWDAARSAFHGRERAYLEALLDGLEPPSSVLDLGCGTGRPMAAHALARGHRVTGVDQAEALLALARSRYPTGTWINATIESFAPAESFDAIVCWDALFHIDRTLHELLFARIFGMLSPGGRFMLTVGGCEHPAFTDSMHGATFFYDSHPPDRVLAMLGHLGFTPVVAEFMDLPTGGRDKGRYAIVARKT